MKKVMLFTMLVFVCFQINAQWTGTSPSPITTTQNVGIGTATPLFRLSVNGTANISQRTIGINDYPMVFLPDQSFFNGSLAIGNGLRNLVPYPAISYGDGNTAVGNYAMYQATTAEENTAVGTGSMGLMLSGQSNTAMGFNSLYGTTDGSYNTAIGQISLVTNSTGGANTAVGGTSLSANSTGNSNTAIGYAALAHTKTGSNNVGVGTFATTTGPNIQTLNNASAIGAFALIGKSNAMSLGDTTKPTLVGIGTAYPDYMLDVRSAANPARFTGLQTGSLTDKIVTADANGVLRQLPFSSLPASLSAGQGITFEGTKIQLGDYCGSGGGKFLKDREINMNDYNLYFNSAVKGKIYMGMEDERDPCKKLITRLEISSKGLTTVNGYSPNASPSGLRFTDLTAKRETVENKYKGVLSLDEDGDVIWVDDQIGLMRAAPEVSKEEYNSLKNEVAVLKQDLEKQQALVAKLIETVEALKGNNNNSVTKMSTVLSNENSAVLGQNTPNPFDKSTTISFTIPAAVKNAAVSFTAADGRPVKTTEISARGKGILTVAAGELSAGTYLYTLVADGRVVETKKMVILK